MNRIAPWQEDLLDRMLVRGYPIRVICEAAQVSRQTVQARRNVLKFSGALCFCHCACGADLFPWRDDGWIRNGDDHLRKPCAKRRRRSYRLLRRLRRCRSRRKGVQNESDRSDRRTHVTEC